MPWERPIRFRSTTGEPKEEGHASGRGAASGSSGRDSFLLNAREGAHGGVTIVYLTG
jgi:hypothetical protein